MSLVVFAGPSVHGLPPALFCGLDRQPPARRGDLPRAVEAGARAILLLDGTFGDGPTVSHKEVLAALSHGVAVAGAASLGALRAAECRGFGMVGLGRVFADYAEGRRIADADVAVLHAPAELGFAPITLPLVDAEATLAALGPDLPAAAVEALRRRARDLHFTARSWEVVAAALPEEARAPTLALLSRRAVSVKAEDARLALGWLRGFAP